MSIGGLVNRRMAARWAVPESLAQPLVLLAIVGLGMALRLGAGWGDPVTLVSDFRSHHGSALRLMDGIVDRNLLMKGPGVAPLMALGYLVMGGAEYHHWLIWNSAVLFPLAALALYGLSNQAMKGSWPALLPVLIFAIWPPFIDATRLVALENAVVLGVCLSTWLFFRALQLRTIQASLLAGLAFGFALLIKAVFVIIAPLFSFAFFLRPGWRFPFIRIDLGPRYRNWWCAVVFTIAAVATIGPWQAYSYSQLGKFVPIAAYGQLALYVGNQPFGDDAYMAAQGLAGDLMPDWTVEHELATDYSPHRDYALEYVTRYPLSVFREFRMSMEQLFMPLNRMADWVRVGGADALTASPLAAAGMAAVIVAGVLGFLARAAPGDAAALNGIRALWFYGYFISLFLLIKGDSRHRLAFEPFLFLLAAWFLWAALAQPWRSALLMPARGFEGWARGLHIATKSTFHAVRTHWRPALAAGAVGLGLFGVSWMNRPITVGPDDLVGGTVEVVRTGEMAIPNPAIGLHTLREDVPFEAVFEVDAARAGRYRMDAVYSATRSYPLDVIVNGEVAIHGGFQQSFGGAYNRFARHAQVGEVALQEGRNRIALRETGWDRTAPRARRVADVPIGPADSLAEEIRRRAPDAAFTLDPSPLGGGALRLTIDTGGQRIAFYGTQAALPEPLRAEESYTMRLRHEVVQGNLDLRLYLLSFDSEGERIRAETFSAALNSVRQGGLLKPGQDLQVLQALFHVNGRGVVDLPPTVAIDRSQDTWYREGHYWFDLYRKPGDQFYGPFIERLTFDCLTC